MAPRKEKKMYKKLTFKNNNTAIVRLPNCVVAHECPEDECMRWITTNFLNVKRIEDCDTPRGVLHLHIYPVAGEDYSLFRPTIVDETPLSAATSSINSWLTSHVPHVEHWELWQLPTVNSVSDLYKHQMANSNLGG